VSINSVDWLTIGELHENYQDKPVPRSVSVKVAARIAGLWYALCNTEVDEFFNVPSNPSSSVSSSIPYHPVAPGMFGHVPLAGMTSLRPTHAHQLHTTGYNASRASCPDGSAPLHYPQVPGNINNGMAHMVAAAGHYDHNDTDSILSTVSSSSSSHDNHVNPMHGNNEYDGGE
jgi:hypothetical protein